MERIWTFTQSLPLARTNQNLFHWLLFDFLHQIFVMGSFSLQSSIKSNLCILVFTFVLAIVWFSGGYLSIKLFYIMYKASNTLPPPFLIPGKVLHIGGGASSPQHVCCMPCSRAGLWERGPSTLPAEHLWFYLPQGWNYWLGYFVNTINPGSSTWPANHLFLYILTSWLFYLRSACYCQGSFNIQKKLKFRDCHSHMGKLIPSFLLVQCCFFVLWVCPCVSYGFQI